ncbi:MAG: long-chain fatty acid--CoA ligase [Deltaproteobacteria bacterium]|nr:MAG: long-chain fatty acid--CoA ligase [Deltaproteobacteria bacterium]
MTHFAGQILEEAARREGDRPLWCDARAGRWYSARELARWAARIAGGLRTEGVAPGMRVGLCAEASGAYVAAFFGALRAGATVVPFSTRSVPVEIARRADASGVRHLVCDGATQATCREAAALSEASVRPKPLRLDALSGPPLQGEVPPAGDALLLFTSGTVARPRAVRIPHRSLVVHTGHLARHALPLGREDVLLCALPLSHSFGARLVMLLALATGARVVCLPRFDPEESLEAARRHRVTWIPAVPTLLSDLAEAAQAPLPDLRGCLSAGAPLPGAVAETARQRLGAPVRQGYGLTEASFSALDAPPLPPVPASVGRPVHGVEIRIVSPNGEVLRPGQTGEIHIRGPHLCSGYESDGHLEPATDAHGFLHTGDVGRFDESGRLYVVDRLKDVILRGGYTVYPSLVESVLCEHPAVAAAAVVGAPDTRLGEEVVAFVVLRRRAAVSAPDLLAWCGRRIGAHLCPREVHFVDALPVGPSGKVQRRTLRARLGEKVSAAKGP